MTTATPEADAPATATTPAEPPAAPAAKASDRLPAKEWAKIEALWEEGDTTYADLVKKYGKSVSTFERHFKKHKIVKGKRREERKKKADEKLTQAAIDDATVLANRIRETKEEHYRMSSAVARLTWNEILAAKNEGRAVATALNNLKALDAAATVLKKVREERFAVLGLDRNDTVNPDEVPELVISELTAEQIEELRKRDHMETDDKPPPSTEGGAAAGVDPDEDLSDEPEADDEIVDEGGEA